MKIPEYNWNDLANAYKDNIGIADYDDCLFNEGYILALKDAKVINREQYDYLNRLIQEMKEAK